MNPQWLLVWDTLLGSPQAFAVLLLAASMAINGALVASIRKLYKDNQSLHKDYQDHLRAQHDFVQVLGAVREGIAIHREGTGR